MITFKVLSHNESDEMHQPILSTDKEISSRLLNIYKMNMLKPNTPAQNLAFYNRMVKCWYNMTSTNYEFESYLKKVINKTTAHAPF